MEPSSFPELYQHLFPSEILKFHLPETKATCDRCAMQPGRTRTKITYRSDLKCCTYEPFLPNFYVGALLSSKLTSDLGRKTLVEKIEKRKYALPIGMVAAVRFQIEFNQRRVGEFGNREDWLCPYYNRAQQNCGIHQYRGSVCISFFCKSVAGRPGLSYWQQVQNYLSYVEMALLEEALVQLDFSPRQMSDLLDYVNRSEGTAAERKTWSLPEAKARKLWNGYYDEQENFYKKCYQFVLSLTKKQFREALGEQGQQLQETLLKTQQRLEIK